MENITAVQEAIENLNQDEKINEGTYLSLMNHLKVIYGKLEHQIAPRPTITFPHRQTTTNIELPPNYPFSSYRKVLSDYSFLIERGRPYDIPTPQDNIDMVMLHHKYFATNLEEQSHTYEWYGSTHQLRFLRALDKYLSNTDESQTQQVRDEIYTNWEWGGMPLIRRLFKYETKFDMRLWKDPEMREKWLSHPMVRNQNIRLVEEYKNEIRKLLVLMRDESDENWSVLFYSLYFPFFNHLQPKKKRNNEWEFKERSETEIKKLHSIKITYKLSAEEHIELELYTDKIQLGRSPIVGDMYRMALVLSLLYDTKSKIESYIRKQHDWMGIYQYPKMTTSGITAKTRNKARTYATSDDDWTIEYKSVNVVETGTE